MRLVCVNHQHHEHRQEDRKTNHQEVAPPRSPGPGFVSGLHFLRLENIQACFLFEVDSIAFFRRQFHMPEYQILLWTVLAAIR